jgi:hypothetical protein
MAAALIVSRVNDEWIEIRLRDGRIRRLRDVGKRLRAVRAEGARVAG